LTVFIVPALSGILLLQIFRTGLAEFDKAVCVYVVVSLADRAFILRGLGYFGFQPLLKAM
jgi:hypothetical protein